MKFSVFIIFIVRWATFVYDFAAHWTWSLGSGGTHVGWTGALPSLDFAGGTVNPYYFWLVWASDCVDAWTKAWLR